MKLLNPSSFTLAWPVLTVTFLLLVNGCGPSAEEGLRIGNEGPYAEEREGEARDELAEPAAEREDPRLLPPGRKGGVGAGREGVREDKLLYAIFG